MKLVNRLELKLDGYEKCHLVSDYDCSLGQLYDYSCALKSYIQQKMKDAEKESESKESE